MDKLQQYYDYLVSQGAPVGSFEEFTAAMSDDSKRKDIYGYVKNNGLEAPDSYDSFSRTLLRPSVANATEAPTVPEATTQVEPEPVKKKEPTESELPSAPSSSEPSSVEIEPTPQPEPQEEKGFLDRLGDYFNRKTFENAEMIKDILDTGASVVDALPDLQELKEVGGERLKNLPNEIFASNAYLWANREQVISDALNSGKAGVLDFTGGLLNTPALLQDATVQYMLDGMEVLGYEEEAANARKVLSEMDYEERRDFIDRSFTGGGPASGSRFSQEAAEKLHTMAEEAREKVTKFHDDLITSAAEGNYGQMWSQLLNIQMESSPYLAASMAGGAGILGMGLSTSSQKSRELQKAGRPYDSRLTTVSAIRGGAEAGGGILFNRIARPLKGALKGNPEGAKQLSKSTVKDITKAAFGEGFEEGAQGAEEKLTEYFMYGGEFDGDDFLREVAIGAIAGFSMGGGVSAGGAAAQAMAQNTAQKLLAAEVITRAAATPEQKKQVSLLNVEIESLEEEFAKLSVSEDTMKDQRLDLLRQAIDRKTVERNRLLGDQLDAFNSLDDNSKKELMTLDHQMNELANKAEDIQNSNLSVEAKEAAFEIIREEALEIIKQKDAILNDQKGEKVQETTKSDQTGPTSSRAFSQSGKKKPETNVSSQTQEFFGDVVEGNLEKYKPSKEYEYEMEFDEEQEQFKELYDTFKGNFDDHIAASIPTFRDVQVKKGKAIVDILPEGGLVIDLGGSEGGFVKSITEASDGAIRSINVDASEKMQKAHEESPVEGSEFERAAFQEGFDDVPAYEPEEKADVVHESMLFQFIGPERASKIKEVKDKYLKEDGVFITEQKFKLNDAQEQQANEDLKDSQHKAKYFTEEQIAAKGEDVLVGMGENQAEFDQYVEDLKKEFDYVEVYWTAGNFRGIIASNNKEKVDQYLEALGDTSNPYNAEPDAETGEFKSSRATMRPVDSNSAKALKDNIKNGRFAILTAENPDAQQLSPEENAARNKVAEEWLRSRGYNPKPVKGKYGNEENSFYVPNMSPSDALDFARTFNQEAVATDFGLLYQDGSINPREKGGEFSAQGAEDMYTEIETDQGPIKVQISYDFDSKQDSGVVVGTYSRGVEGNSFYQDLLKIMSETFGLDTAEAQAAAMTAGLIIQAKAERAGMTAEDYLNQNMDFIRAESAQEFLDQYGYDENTDPSEVLFQDGQEPKNKMSLKKKFDSIGKDTKAILKKAHPDLYKDLENSARAESDPGNVLFQSASQNDSKRNARGAVVIQNAKFTIFALTNPDVTTPLHELSHVYEDVLTEQERQAVLDWAGHEEWDWQTSERFATGFEVYISEGAAPFPALQSIFNRFRDWLNKLLGRESNPRDTVVETPDGELIPLNMKMRIIYSKMLGASEAEISANVMFPNEIAIDLMQDKIFEYDNALREQVREAEDELSDLEITKIRGEVMIDGKAVPIDDKKHDRKILKAKRKLEKAEAKLQKEINKVVKDRVAREVKKYKGPGKEQLDKDFIENNVRTILRRNYREVEQNPPKRSKQQEIDDARKLVERMNKVKDDLYEQMPVDEKPLNFEYTPINETPNREGPNKSEDNRTQEEVDEDAKYWAQKAKEYAEEARKAAEEAKAAAADLGEQVDRLKEQNDRLEENLDKLEQTPVNEINRSNDPVPADEDLNIPEGLDENLDNLRKIQGNKTRIQPRFGNTEASRDPMRIQRIMKRAADLINQIVIFGRTGDSDVKGYYDPESMIIRVKNPADLDTLAHELGHAIDDKVKALDSVLEQENATQLTAELLFLFEQTENYAPEGYTPAQALRYHLREGLAEFFRAYIVNPQELQRVAPALYEFMTEEFLSPEMIKALDKIHEDYSTYIQASASQRIGANVQLFGEKEPLGDRLIPGNQVGEKIKSKFQTTDAKNVTEKFQREVTFQVNNIIPGTFGFDAGIVAMRVENNMAFITFRSKRLKKIYRKLRDGLLYDAGSALEAYRLAMMAKYNIDIKDKGSHGLLPENDFEILSRLLAGFNGAYESMLETGIVLNVPSYSKEMMDLAAELDLSTDEYGRILDPDTGQVMDLQFLFLPLLEMNESGELTEQEMIDAANDTIKFMVAERTLEYRDKLEREENLTGVGAGLQTDVDAALEHIDAFKQRPEREKAAIQEAARRYREFANMGLKYAVMKGRMSKEEYDKITSENEYYVNLSREMVVMPLTTVKNAPAILKATSKGISHSALTKKIKGGGQEIKNPYGSLLGSVAVQMYEADKNEVLASWADAFSNTVDQLGKEARGFDRGEEIDLSGLVVRGEEGDPQSLTVFKNGEKETWRIVDPDLYQSINALADAPQLGDLLKKITMPNQWLKSSITNFPLFAIKNFARDSVNTWMISQGGVNPMDTLNKISGEDKNAFNTYGGSQAGFHHSTEAGYMDMMEQTMKQISANGGRVQDIRRYKKFSLANYRSKLEGAENRNRLLEFQKVKKMALDKYGYDEYNANMLAAFHARDLMDFAVAGHWMRAINRWIPFSNAWIQGMRRGGKSLMNNPLKYGFRTFIYTLMPTALMHAMAYLFDYEDEYEDLPAWQRDLHWNFKIPGVTDWISIPKPFENGAWSTVFDRMISDYKGVENPYAGMQESLGTTFIAFDRWSLSGPVKPFLEGASNYSSFRQGPITKQTNKPFISRKGREEASRLSQNLTSAFGLTDPYADANLTDHYIRSYTSYLGALAQKAGDIGKENSRYKFGLPYSTGLMRQLNPVGKAGGEAYELTAELQGWNNKKYLKFKQMLDQYYEIQGKGFLGIGTLKEREAKAKEIRDYLNNDYLPYMREKKKEEDAKKRAEYLEKKQKDLLFKQEKLVQEWTEEGIRIVKARWGRHNIIKGKTKIELSKDVDAASLSLDEVKALIEEKAPKKKKS